MRESRREARRKQLAARPDDPVAVIQRQGNGLPVMIAVADDGMPFNVGGTVKTYKTLRGARRQANATVGYRGRPGVVILLELHRLAMVADDVDLEGERVVRMTGAEFAERQITLWADIATRLAKGSPDYTFTINVAASRRPRRKKSTP